MTTKELEQMLYEYPAISSEIVNLSGEFTDALKCQAELIEEKYNTLKSNAVTSTPQKGVISNPVLQAVVELENMVTKFNTHMGMLNIRMANLTSHKMFIEQFLEKLSPQEKSVIVFRYFHKLRWCDVSRKAHYVVRQCLRLRERAFEKANVLYSKS